MTTSKTIRILAETSLSSLLESNIISTPTLNTALANHRQFFDSLPCWQSPVNNVIDDNNHQIAMLLFGEFRS